MCDHSNSGVIQVEPGGNLSISDDEDVSHPGSVFLHWAQRVAELLVVLESAGWNIFVPFGLEGKNRKERSEQHMFSLYLRDIKNIYI